MKKSALRKIIKEEIRQVLREDFYQEPKPYERDNVKELESLLDDLIDLDSEFYVIKRDGDDIDFGTKPYTDRMGKKRRAKWDPTERDELIDNIINTLSNNGFDYESKSRGDYTFYLEKI